MSKTCRRVLVKLSGEALAGAEGFGISGNILRQVAGELVAASASAVEIGVVIGGGNLFRGTEMEAAGLQRTTGDYMGMLATVMNALAMRDAVVELGRDACVMSAFPIGPVCMSFDRRSALEKLASGSIVLFAAGTGNPYFTTDTAASLRAIEINADAMFKATKVDGIYDRDPMKFPDAQRFDHITFEDALDKQLGVMDATALVLCRDNNMPVRVFDLMDRGALKKILDGENIGTTVAKG